jgi:hypothetical protein
MMISLHYALFMGMAAAGELGDRNRNIMLLSIFSY